MEREEYLKIAATLVRRCRSIHCRHYDLADGMFCEVEFARLKAMHERGEWPALAPMLPGTEPWKVNLTRSTDRRE